MTRKYTFGKPLGVNFSRIDTRRQFMCHGIEGESTHAPAAVLSVMIENQSSPVGYICPTCGNCWTTRRGDRMLLPRVVDPIELPEPKPVHIGVAGRKYLERKRTGRWPGGLPS